MTMAQGGALVHLTVGGPLPLEVPAGNGVAVTARAVVPGWARPHRHGDRRHCAGWPGGNARACRARRRRERNGGDRARGAAARRRACVPIYVAAARDRGHALCRSRARRTGAGDAAGDEPGGLGCALPGRRWHALRHQGRRKIGRGCDTCGPRDRGLRRRRPSRRARRAQRCAAPRHRRALLDRCPASSAAERRCGDMVGAVRCVRARPAAPRRQRPRSASPWCARPSMCSA